ncbi:MAG: winged helix-turn-helix domain-containing protein [Verrucomicrobia bacterium]|nr:winged helix-turn-helix domain-containing protein [Verrucomicrobiota bacterium]
MIVAVIEEEFGVGYRPGHVRKLLPQMGFSVQRLRRHLAQADPQLQNRWRRYTFPRLKKPSKKAAS